MEQHGGELQAINTGEGLRVIATLPAESGGDEQRDESGS
jgi:hypothetical protein